MFFIENKGIFINSKNVMYFTVDEIPDWHKTKEEQFQVTGTLLNGEDIEVFTCKTYEEAISFVKNILEMEE
jgi:hypothetical protein